jgi:hypothetical protein
MYIFDFDLQRYSLHITKLILALRAQKRSRPRLSSSRLLFAAQQKKAGFLPVMHSVTLAGTSR